MAAQFCQLYSSCGTSLSTAAEKSTTWKFTMPTAVGAGNRLVLIVAYSTTTAPTITDNNGNSWPAGSVTASSGAVDLTIWDLKNANAGTTTITIAFGAAQQPVWWECQEWSGLSTSLGNSGTNQTASVLAPNLAFAAPFTPTNNNANGGNLILAFYYDAATAGDVGPTTFSPGSGFTPMEANVISKSTSGQMLPNASEYFVQTPFASINPGMTANGDTIAHYNCVAIALPLFPGAGTPPSSSAIRIAKSIKNISADQFNATTIPLQFPTTGNLRVFMSSQTDGSALSGAIASVTDSEGNTWTNESQGSSTPAVFIFKNASPNPNLVVTLHITNVGRTNMDGWLVDVANAATGTVVGAVGSAASAARGPGVTGHLPDLTPTVTNSLILVSVSNGLGPTKNLSSPAGGISNNIVIGANDADEADSGQTNTGDAFGYIYNTSRSAQSWTWELADASPQSVSAAAIELLPGPASSSIGLNPSRVLMM